MAGLGSGRHPWRNTGTADARYSIDVNVLHRAKVERGATLVWTWSGSDGSSASVAVRSEGHALTLGYSVNGVRKREVLSLEQRPCHFGGHRTWLRCPKCGRRAGRVYLSSTRFVCRKCARLAYRSQRVDLSTRGWWMVRKAQRALGLNPDLEGMMRSLPKPKGMHWRTFRRHIQKLERAVEMRDEWLRTPSRALLKLLNRPCA